MNTVNAALALGVALVVAGAAATVLSTTSSPSDDPHGGAMAGRRMMDGMGYHGHDMDEMEEWCDTMTGEHDHDDAGGP